MTHENEMPVMAEELSVPEAHAPLPEAAGEDPIARERDDWRDKAFRAAAELDNFRKRSQQEVAEARLYAAQSFAKDVLAVADNLSRALSAPAGNEPALRQGVEMTASQFEQIMGRHGITRITVTAGEPLNPDLHQVMLEVEADSVEPGQIVAELQAGYTLHGRLLRAAMVSVKKS